MSKHLVAILHITTGELTVTEAARRYNINRQHLHRLLTRYRAEGEAGLTPRSKRPHTNPQQTPPEMRKRIIQLRQHLTANGHDAGPATIAWHLEHDGARPPALSTIRRILHLAGLITPEPRVRPYNSYVRFEAAAPNETWQSDFTHWRLDDGSDTEILNWLDDHSRYLLDCHAMPRVTGDDVVTTFLALTETYGVPASTLTDNGVVYTARFQGGKNAVEHLLPLLGVTQKNGKPGHPQTQGKIERFHQTLKRFLTKQPRARTISELQQQLNRFRGYYNEERPHRARDRAAPRTAYRATPKALPAGTSNNAGTYRVRYDRVHRESNLSLRRSGRMHHLGVGAVHKGKRVVLLIDEHTVTVVDLFTGEILAKNLIEPARNYWRNQLKPAGRWPQTKQESRT